MGMAVRVESMRRDTEAAVSDRTIFRPPPVRVGHSVGSAVAARPETHRYRTDGRSAHQRQDDTARAFHGEAPGHSGRTRDILSFSANQASQSRCFHSIVRNGTGPGCRQPPPEKCDVNACANEPKPPRVTPPEPESEEVPDDAWLDEESPLKKLLREDPPDEPWPPPDEDPRGGHPAPDCTPDGAAIPAAAGVQLSLGISA
jgi:hypothetical protein